MGQRQLFCSTQTREKFAPRLSRLSLGAVAETWPAPTSCSDFGQLLFLVTLKNVQCQLWLWMVAALPWNTPRLNQQNLLSPAEDYKPHLLLNTEISFLNTTELLLCWAGQIKTLIWLLSISGLSAFSGTRVCEQESCQVISSAGD